MHTLSSKQVTRLLKHKILEISLKGNARQLEGNINNHILRERNKILTYLFEFILFKKLCQNLTERNQADDEEWKRRSDYD